MRRPWVPIAIASILLAACARDDEAPSHDSLADPATGGGRSTVPAPAALAEARSGVTPATFAVQDGSGSLDRVTEQTAADRALLIRTGRLVIKVDSLEQAVRRVTSIAGTLGGFVAGASIQAGERQSRSATLEVKVPAARYDGAVGALDSVGRVTSSTTTTEDVGEEFVDVGARVENARRLEQRLVSLLAQRTGKLEEALAVERELARVREEIERYEGRLRFLRSRVAMSTIAVTLYEPGPLVGQPGTNPIVAALRQSWRNFVGAVAGGIELAGALAPVALVLGLVGIGVRRWWRRRTAAQPVI
jgi:Domain of unknown function (DUF4349)